MKVLVINGSPKGNRSNTYQLAKAFLEGMEEGAGAAKEVFEAEEIQVYRFLLGTPMASYTGAVNSVFPVVMGIFTVWFQKWYPAKIARGE